MPLSVPTTIATGFGSASGCDYRQTTDQLLVADSGYGTIVAVNSHTHARTVLGSGYTDPSDIALSADGLHAYITENPGTLVRASLTNLNRAAATVIASGFNGIDQVALDETHGFAYVTEFSGGHLQRVNLSTGVKTVVATIGFPRGVLVTSDGRFAYVSGDTDTIVRFDLAAGTSVIIAAGLNAPRHLTWADAGESVILFPQPNPTGTVMRVDLTLSPAAITPIAGPTPPNPYSVAVLSSNQILIAGGSTVSEADLTSSVYTAAGPILLGVGFVPADPAHLPGGFANTTADPTYFFQVKDCPFGGTLPLMINWEHARSLGANFYQVYVDAILITTPFSDYLWSVALNEFELQTNVPVSGFYPLHSAGQIWLNFWLGLLLDTTGFSNGLHTITVRIFSAQSTASEIILPATVGHAATLMIDNTQPTAVIEKILQQPGSVPINTCAIVTTGAPTFTFQVTASAPAHLLSWSLGVVWGDNKSGAITSDTYSHHVTPSRIWTGITSVAVPPPGPSPWNATVAGDPTSTHCAHTFILNAWDRVINGWGYIHGPAEYTKSVTLML